MRGSTGKVERMKRMEKRASLNLDLDQNGIDLDLLANGQTKASINGATVSGMVISRLEVGRSTVGITSLADGLRARVGSANGGNNSETVLGELRASTHVDAGKVPEDGVTGLGVLELENIGLVGVGGQLDGDTTAIGVGLPGLLVGTTTRLDSLHGTDILSDGPGVDVTVQGVGDLDAAASRGSLIAANHHAGGQGSSQSSEESGEAESLGEHHFECGNDRLNFLLGKKKTVMYVSV